MSVIALAAVGFTMQFVINRFVYTPFQRKGTALLGMVIVSLAVSLMIANAMLPIVGYFSVAYRERFSHLLRFGEIALTVNQIIMIVLAVAVMLAVHALLRYTRLGKAMRATAANPMLARNCGIPTQRVVDLVWLITGALCGVAGTVAAMNSESFAVASGAGFLIPIIAAAG